MKKTIKQLERDLIRQYAVFLVQCERAKPEQSSDLAMTIKEFRETAADLKKAVKSDSSEHNLREAIEVLKSFSGTLKTLSTTNQTKPVTAKSPTKPGPIPAKFRKPQQTASKKDYNEEATQLYTGIKKALSTLEVGISDDVRAVLLVKGDLLLDILDEAQDALQSDYENLSAKAGAAEVAAFGNKYRTLINQASEQVKQYEEAIVNHNDPEINAIITSYKSAVREYEAQLQAKTSDDESTLSDSQSSAPPSDGSQENSHVSSDEEDDEIYDNFYEEMMQDMDDSEQEQDHKSAPASEKSSHASSSFFKPAPTADNPDQPSEKAADKITPKK